MVKSVPPSGFNLFLTYSVLQVNKKKLVLLLTFFHLFIICSFFGK
ncbi:hypothetical protein D927_01525 [Enterococcus faecalis 02-MB-BW-10]|nr:hypothetical protein D927_01525 [Enterococcus faecalis 02-MB-BW-10]